MIYWLLLLGIIIYNIKHKKDGNFYLWIGFYLFLTGSVINILGFINFSETLMRVCFVLLLFGFAYSAIKYLKS